MKKLHLEIHDNLPVDKVMQRMSVDIPLYLKQYDNTNIICHAMSDKNSYDGIIIEIYHGRGKDPMLLIQELSKKEE